MATLLNRKGKNEKEIRETRRAILALKYNPESPFQYDKPNMTLSEWKILVGDLADQEKYLQPYPPSMIRKFWENNLNPITGMPTVAMVRQTETIYNLGDE